MRVVYITNQICGAGGLERVLSIKCSYLADRLDYDIHIITLNQEEASVFYDFSNKIHNHDLLINGKGFAYFKNYRNKLNECVSEIKPDVVCVCDDGLKGFYVPKILKHKCPIVYERHASKLLLKKNENPSLFEKSKYFLYEKLMNYGAKSYDAFIVLTHFNVSEWNLEKIMVIPNPLSFYPNSQSSLSNKRVITVGNHGFQKGYDRLIKIWKNVIDQHPNWTLDVYGKIDKENKHLKLAEQLDINRNINFHEPVKNIENKYKEASIYAMTSRSEGFGMVLIEAMALGLPCIAFDCPCGPRDIIDNLVNGFLVKEGDIEEYSEKLVRLINDIELRKDMGINARETAKNYEVGKIVSQWDDLFKMLLKR